jgi:putative peptidoglycan lipid II flippase
VRTLWLIMLALLGILASGTVGQITSVAFYAMGDTKTPTRLSILTFLIYVPLKVIIFLRYGLIGLAVTTSIYFVTNFVLQLFILERTIARRDNASRRP